MPDKGGIFRKVYGGEEREAFEIRDLVVFENGKYVWKEQLSVQGKERICSHLTKEEQREFLEFLKQRESMM